MYGYTYEDKLIEIRGDTGKIAFSKTGQLNVNVESEGMIWTLMHFRKWDQINVKFHSS